jgi:hypothetical protein
LLKKISNNSLVFILEKVIITFAYPKIRISVRNLIFVTYNQNLDLCQKLQWANAKIGSQFPQNPLKNYFPINFLFSNAQKPGYLAVPIGDFLSSHWVSPTQGFHAGPYTDLGEVQ